MEAYTARNIDDWRLKRKNMNPMLRLEWELYKAGMTNKRVEERMKNLERDFEEKKAKNTPYGLLCQALADRDSYVRKQAARALVKMRTKWGIEKLGRCVGM